MATGRKKRKQSNIPRRKRFRRKQRLQSAKSWLSTYQGDNIVKAYRKRFGVDWPTAFRELEMLGIEIDPAYKEPVLQTVQGQIEARRRKRAERAAELERVLGEDQDEHLRSSQGTPAGAFPMESPGKNGTRSKNVNPKMRILGQTLETVGLERHPRPTRSAT